MTVALGLVATAVLIGVFAPTYLRAIATPSLRPGLALAGWVSAAVMMSTAALGAAVLFAIPGASGVDNVIGMADSCLNVIRGGDVVIEHVLRLTAIAVIAGLVLRTTVIAVRRVHAHRHWRTEHLGLLRTVCRCEESVLWAHEPTPVAYSVGGRDSAVVATEGVRDLGASRCEAVLAHERAHLRGRHHLLVLAADILAAALPFLPLARRAPGAVRVLAELAADAVAARRHGPAPVRAALMAMSRQCSRGTLDSPAPALEMSRDAVETRLSWLAQYRPEPQTLRVRADYALGVALGTVPVVLAVSGVAALATLCCLAVAA